MHTKIQKGECQPIGKQLLRLILQGHFGIVNTNWEHHISKKVVKFWVSFSKSQILPQPDIRKESYD